MERVILFDGTSTDGWTYPDGSGPIDWIVEGNIMTVGHEDIVSKETFRDAHVHVEWREPDMPWASGQLKGNSGVYLHGIYEVQILDSYGKPEDKLEKNDCGAIYTICPPLQNACRPALEWQTYDIYFRAPRFDEEGNVTENARITVLQNDRLIQNNVELFKTTGGGITREKLHEGPLLLQDHGHPVSFRNVWFERF